MADQRRGREPEIQGAVRDALRKLAAAPEKSWFGPPADARTVQFASRALVKAGFAGLPRDYTVLLEQACGLHGPYCTLLSPGGMRLAGGGIRPGIQQESEGFDAGTATGEKLLVLGALSGDVVLVFAEGEYRLVDGLSRDVLGSYETIAAFIGDIIALKERGHSSAMFRGPLKNESD